ncbi:MAG: AlpA family transcriptional regulator [Sphingorhabdus sp.]
MRLPEVKIRVGLGRSTIYRRMEAGTFPKAKSLGGGLVAWVESDIDGWIAERMACPSDY